MIMRFVIFTGGDFTLHFLSQKSIEKAERIIAADSGANTAVQHKIYPSVVVGDFDSIDKTTKALLKEKGVQSVRYNPQKDETDTELAIDYAIKEGASEITVLGGIAGNRLDHILATLLLSTNYAIPIRFINSNQISWIKNGPSSMAIDGKKGDLLSLIPLTASVHNITTKNLHYPLKNESLLFGKPRGISNVFTRNKAYVKHGSGILLFIHTIHDRVG